MSGGRIDQLLPAAHAGDATGDAAIHLATVLSEAGYDAGLYALTIDDELTDRVRPFDDFPAPGSSDLTILHFALPSPLSRALLGFEGRRAIVYHNLTPPQLLLPHCPEIARLTAAGAEELAMLGASGRIDLAIGVSEFNATGLRTAGFDTTVVLPLPVDLSRYEAAPDPLLAQRLRDAPPIVLTVGRIAPNKRLEDLLRVAAYYLAHIDHDAWFVIVGGDRGLEDYAAALSDLAADLGLDARLRRVGRVSHAELIAWYEAASAYLCTSAHEGFCAPLLEAMHFGVPILARRAGAVPETLGGAGLTYDDPDPAAVGEMLHLLMSDDALRERLRASQRRRLGDFASETVDPRWTSVLTALADGGKVGS